MPPPAKWVPVPADEAPNARTYVIFNGSNGPFGTVGAK